MISRLSCIRRSRIILTRVASQRPPVIAFNCSSSRFYAQSWDNRQHDEKVDAHIKVQQLMDKIHSHPNVMEKLEKVSEIMVNKGLVNDDNSKAPGPWQMIKILMDKDLKAAMNDFKQELEKTGIELGPNQLGPLMSVLGIEKK